MSRLWTAKQLEEMPTLSVGQTDNLKVDDGRRRVWLARTGVEDGEPYNNRITIEKLIDGRWETVDNYPG